MGLITKIKEFYDRFEAGKTRLPDAELKHSITLGGTGVLFNSGNWVGSDAPGNRYSSWAGWNAGGDSSLHKNSAYMACLSAYQDAFSQAPVIIKKMHKDGTKTPEPNHPLMEMLELVNASDDSVSLLDGTLDDYIGHGNAYWLIVNDKTGDSKTGNPVQLEYLPFHRMKPKTARDLGREPKPGDPAILEYEYTADTKPQTIPIEEIVHMRLGKRPWQPWMGMGRGDLLMDEIFTDSEATNYSGTILANMGISPQIFSPKPPPQGMTQTGFNASDIVKTVQQARSGRNRGSTVAINALLDIFESGITPESMALDIIRRYPESRICAVTRVPAMVAGLLAGEGTRTYSNYEEAREAFWQDSVLPMMRRIRLQVTRQLIWRNKKYSDRTIWFGFNYDEVPALQVDEQARDKNIRENFKYGIIDAAEARGSMGMDAKPEDEGRMYKPDAKPEEEEDEDPEEALLRRTAPKAYESPIKRISAELALLEAGGNGA